jgi:drug/metabolite transporter (DMT)-like permease
MSPFVLGLVLGAALLHASWNAALRGGSDRLWGITVMAIATAVVVLPVAFFLPLPKPESWPFLALSAGLHTGYCIMLVKAYGAGDFGQVYPIARGSAPMLVTLAAMLLAAEVPPPATLAGIVLVSAGIFGLAKTKSSGPTSLSLATAMATGLFIASYTVSDGLGARASGHPISYSIWLFLLYTPPLWVAFRLMRGRWTAPVPTRDTATAAIGGLVSMVAYTAVIWAASISPLGPVSALRETSVVMAAFIARVVFGEPLSPRRLGACLVIAAGALLIGWR